MSSMSVHVPQQARAKVTYEELLSATQKILAQRGIAAVSTNLISSNAGVSPPSFYRYFRNKHEILMALPERLQTLQNNVIQTKIQHLEPTKEDFISLTAEILLSIYEVTRKFEGGFELTAAMHAHGELRPVLERYQQESADIIADMVLKLQTGLDPKQTRIKCRLASETGYCAIELLLKDSRFPKRMITEQAAKAVFAIIFE